MENIVILTGAGISAESGIKTFRASDGLWEEHRIQDVATPEAFLRDPELVQRFYDTRRKKIQLAEPNPAHLALAELESHWQGDFLLVTQNIDDLHERAGSKNLIHMHGELLKGWCLSCDGRSAWHADLIDHPACPKCGISGQMRPDIVWFGEMPYQMERIYQALSQCDLFVSIGTSGQVYPAAGFVDAALVAGAQTLEINLEPSAASSAFHRSNQGLASQLVPQWAAQYIAA